MLLPRLLFCQSIKYAGIPLEMFGCGSTDLDTTFSDFNTLKKKKMLGQFWVKYGQTQTFG